MSKKLIVLVGPPGSGKSTLSQRYVSQGYVRVNQDDQGADHLDVFDNALLDRYDIIVDRMGFSKQQRSRYLELAKSSGYETEIIVIHTPQDLCLSRIANRKDHPTIKDRQTAEKAINFFFSKYEKVQNDEANKVTNLLQTGFQDAIICDLDGTLCDVEHREHFVRREGKKDWKGFFQAMIYDVPKPHVLEILKRFSKDHEIVFCSGRPKEYKDLTTEWLRNNLEPHGIKWHLFMREAGDHRLDSIVKEIILDFEILPRWNPVFILDDRDQVVKMWRERGLQCLQVAPGDF